MKNSNLSIKTIEMEKSLKSTGKFMANGPISYYIRSRKFGKKGNQVKFLIEGE